MTEIPKDARPAAAPVLHPDPTMDRADLFRLALGGWITLGAGAGLEALFDRMEAAR